jgi:predicted  nucleic acid-binding Zn-ribbon protein
MAAGNQRVEQFQQLLDEQTKIRDGFIKDMAGHQKIFRHWLDQDLEVLKNRSDRLRDELNRRDGTCERLAKEKLELSERLHRVEVDLEKERMIRASIEQLIHVRAEEATSKGQDSEDAPAKGGSFPRAA